MFILEHKPSRYSFCSNYIKQSGAEKIFYNQQKDREILPWKRSLHLGIPGIPLSFGVVESDPPGVAGAGRHQDRQAGQQEEAESQHHPQTGVVVSLQASL